MNDGRRPSHAANRFQSIAVPTRKGIDQCEERLSRLNPVEPVGHRPVMASPNCHKTNLRGESRMNPRSKTDFIAHFERKKMDFATSKPKKQARPGVPRLRQLPRTNFAQK